MFRSTFAVALLAFAGCVSMEAQTVKLQATIPFEFRAGAQLLPAGEYIVTHSAGVLLIRGQYERPKSAGVLVFGVAKGAGSAGDKLVFNRYGENYFLSSVWQAGAASGLMVPRTKREKEIASSYSRSAQATTIALSRK